MNPSLVVLITENHWFNFLFVRRIPGLSYYSERLFWLGEEGLVTLLTTRSQQHAVTPLPASGDVTSFSMVHTPHQLRFLKSESTLPPEHFPLDISATKKIAPYHHLTSRSLRSTRHPFIRSCGLGHWPMFVQAQVFEFVLPLHDTNFLHLDVQKEL